MAMKKRKDFGWKICRYEMKDFIVLYFYFYFLFYRLETYKNIFKKMRTRTAY